MLNLFLISAFIATAWSSTEPCNADYVGPFNTVETFDGIVSGSGVGPFAGYPLNNEGGGDACGGFPADVNGFGYVIWGSAVDKLGTSASNQTVINDFYYDICFTPTFFATGPDNCGVLSGAYAYAETSFEDGPPGSSVANCDEASGKDGFGGSLPYHLYSDVFDLSAVDQAFLNFDYLARGSNIRDEASFRVEWSRDHFRNHTGVLFAPSTASDPADGPNGSGLLRSVTIDLERLRVERRVRFRFVYERDPAGMGSAPFFRDWLVDNIEVEGREYKDVRVAVFESVDPLFVESSENTGVVTYTARIEYNGPTCLLPGEKFQVQIEYELPGVGVTQVGPETGLFVAKSGIANVAPASNGWIVTLTDMEPETIYDLTFSVKASDAALPEVDAITVRAFVIARPVHTVGRQTDDASESTSIEAPVDLHVTVDQSATSLVAGDERGAQFVVTVENLGPSTARNVVIDTLLTLPDGVRRIEASAETDGPGVASYTDTGVGGGTFTAPTTGALRVTELDVGDVARVTFYLDAASIAISGAPIQLTASVGSLDEAPELNTDNNEDSGEIAVPQRSDFTVNASGPHKVRVPRDSSSSSSSSSNGRTTFEQTVTVTNDGPSIATDVVIALAHTAAPRVVLSDLSVSSGLTQTTDNTYTLWSLERGLAVDQQVTVTLFYRVDHHSRPGTPVSVVASVKLANGVTYDGGHNDKFVTIIK